jgi:hypothetical protein
MPNGALKLGLWKTVVVVPAESTARTRCESKSVTYAMPVGAITAFVGL